MRWTRTRCNLGKTDLKLVAAACSQRYLQLWSAPS